MRDAGGHHERGVGGGRIEPEGYPLLTGDSLAAVLRPGNQGAAAHAVPILRRVVAVLRRALPEVAIPIRGDSGFATPAVYDFR